MLGAGKADGAAFVDRRLDGLFMRDHGSISLHADHDPMQPRRQLNEVGYQHSRDDDDRADDSLHTKRILMLALMQLKRNCLTAAMQKVQ